MLAERGDTEADLKFKRCREDKTTGECALREKLGPVRPTRCRPPRTSTIRLMMTEKTTKIATTAKIRVWKRVMQVIIAALVSMPVER